jgi:hypothetical protein
LARPLQILSGAGGGALATGKIGPSPKGSLAALPMNTGQIWAAADQGPRRLVAKAKTAADRRWPDAPVGPPLPKGPCAALSATYPAQPRAGMNLCAFQPAFEQLVQNWQLSCPVAGKIYESGDFRPNPCDNIVTLAKAPPWARSFQAPQKLCIGPAAGAAGWVLPWGLKHGYCPRPISAPSRTPTDCAGGLRWCGKRWSQHG